MEEKKQTLIAHQDIFSADGNLDFMVILEYLDSEGRVKHVYRANYPNKFYAPDPFLERYRIVFN